jgi:hypothetical protein
MNIAGCSKKTEKEQYMEASKKLLELYKSEDFWKLPPADQQKKMQDIVQSSGLELGNTMEEQTKAFKAISAKYKDDPEAQKLNLEMKNAVMEHMLKSGQMAPPQEQKPEDSPLPQQEQQQMPGGSPHGH